MYVDGLHVAQIAVIDRLMTPPARATRDNARAAATSRSRGTDREHGPVCTSSSAARESPRPSSSGAARPNRSPRHLDRLVTDDQPRLLGVEHLAVCAAAVVALE